MMKRICTLALCAVLVLVQTVSSPAFSEEDVTGHALYTDIVAQIDGRPLPSYNVGGRTAVMVQDLSWHGFYVYWNEEARAAYVWPESLMPAGDWERETPDYVPQPPEGRVGDPAYPIYPSDVKVYVAGEEKESFNIGGHTMVYLSDLTAYGDLTWKGEARLAELTLARDPVELALGREEAELEGAGLNCYFDRYPGPHGTLAVYGQYGTSHGTSCRMLYVDRSGQQTRLDMLFPNYGFGAQFYLAPTEIQFDESGDRLTFITPVKEELDGETGTSKDWGDTLCTFHTQTGQMESMVPKGQPLAQWSVSLVGNETAEIDSGLPLELAVGLDVGAYEARVIQSQIPDAGMTVTAGNEGVAIVHDMSFALGQESPYGQGLRALNLLSLPSITQADFTKENTREQRGQAARYFQVTLNGQPISGDLWWSQGNGHIDLNFDYDQPISLGDGDVLKLWAGVPGEM